MSPVIIQAASSPPVDPASRAMSAETMKMPEPIIEPTTIVVESNRPSPRTNPEVSVSAEGAVTVVVLASDNGRLPILSPRLRVTLKHNCAAPSNLKSQRLKPGYSQAMYVTAESRGPQRFLECHS